MIPTAIGDEFDGFVDGGYEGEWKYGVYSFKTIDTHYFFQHTVCFDQPPIHFHLAMLPVLSLFLCLIVFTSLGINPNILNQTQCYNTRARTGY